MHFLRAFKPIALDLIATIFFVAVYWGSQKAGLTAQSAIILATAMGVLAGIARFAWMKLRKQPVGPLQYLAIVLKFGFFRTLVRANIGARRAAGEEVIVEGRRISPATG